MKRCEFCHQPLKKRCEFCRQPLKLSAQGTMHPQCASVSRFKEKHGGVPFFCSTREGARDLAKDAYPLKAKIVDAGKDRVHEGSHRWIHGGARWAVCIDARD